MNQPIRTFSHSTAIRAEHYAHNRFRHTGSQWWEARRASIEAMIKKERLLDELHLIIAQLDNLAEVWGDEGVFRTCRDRLRVLAMRIGGEE